MAVGGDRRRLMWRCVRRCDCSGPLRQPGGCRETPASLRRSTPIRIWSAGGSSMRPPAAPPRIPAGTSATARSTEDLPSTRTPPPARQARPSGSMPRMPWSRSKTTRASPGRGRARWRPGSRRRPRKGEIVSWGKEDFGQMFTLGYIRGRVGVTPNGGYLYMNAETA